MCLIIAFSYLAIAGVHTQYGDITTTWIRGVSDIRWGIDIRGGVDVTFAPPEGYDATDTEMDAAQSIIETRLVSNNITDYELYVDKSNDQIIVRFPWQANDTEFDPEAAVKELGETALLTFREGDSSDLTDGQTYEDLTLVLSGSDVEKASPYYDSQNKEYGVSLTLKESGKVIGEIDAMPEATAPDEENAARDTFSPCWMLNPEYHGKGYAYEAAHAFFDYLFKGKGARRIYAYTEDYNVASQKLCEKLGMRREGLFMEFVSFVNDENGNPIYENTCQYAILKREWEQNGK